MLEKGPRGMFWTKWPKMAHLEHPEKGLSFKKEDERVGRGHFHERVGESPVREEHFGTSGSAVSFFVSEISQFENA